MVSPRPCLFQDFQCCERAMWCMNWVQVALRAWTHGDFWGLLGLSGSLTDRFETGSGGGGVTSECLRRDCAVASGREPGNSIISSQHGARCNPWHNKAGKMLPLAGPVEEVCKAWLSSPPRRPAELPGCAWGRLEGRGKKTLEEPWNDGRRVRPHLLRRSVSLCCFWEEFPWQDLHLVTTETIKDVPMLFKKMLFKIFSS